MLFNSFDFAIFFPIVFVLYWILTRNLRAQNVLILVASYVFYAWWDYRFLFLLIFSISLDYFSGLKIDQSRSQRERKAWLLISILINLGFLGFFKYYNFFIDSFASLLTQVGLNGDSWTLQIILPIGISFYTFHGLSYVFDIYYNRVKPTTNFVDYSVFVSFFPLLVAGPIERATHLLPQVQKPRKFDYTGTVDGLRQVLWGLFKKIVIADTCAGYVNTIFNGYETASGSTLLLGAVLFAFQIYGDFSGYSDIALGISRMMGFSLIRNFSYPYFSRNIAEFWRRWHISLSSWFRDYLYIPLGGSKGRTWLKIRNTFIIFIVSGFWHGANWTFVIWGLLHAIFFLPLLLSQKNRTYLEIVAQDSSLPSLRETASMLSTFALVTFAWIFFRAETPGQAFAIISEIFSKSVFTIPVVEFKIIWIVGLLAMFIVVEWVGRKNQYALQEFAIRYPRTIRWSFYNLLLFLILLFGGKEQQFIYFQF
jgi:D-alanyl-lipoteichoic acid acyltransferase DltB (MBOAT superfamily)